MNAIQKILVAIFVAKNFNFFESGITTAKEKRLLLRLIDTSFIKTVSVDETMENDPDKGFVITWKSPTLKKKIAAYIDSSGAIGTEPEIYMKKIHIMSRGITNHADKEIMKDELRKIKRLILKFRSDKFQINFC